MGVAVRNVTYRHDKPSYIDHNLGSLNSTKHSLFPPKFKTGNAGAWWHIFYSLSHSYHEPETRMRWIMCVSDEVFDIAFISRHATLYTVGIFNKQTLNRLRIFLAIRYLSIVTKIVLIVKFNNYFTKKKLFGGVEKLILCRWKGVIKVETSSAKFDEICEER